MKIKKLAALAAAACMMLGVMTGCENAITIDGEGEAAGETVGSGVIGLSVSTQNNPFFVSLVEGAEAKAEEDGVELVVVDAGDDAAKQASDVEDLISKCKCADCKSGGFRCGCTGCAKCSFSGNQSYFRGPCGKRRGCRLSDCV